MAIKAIETVYNGYRFRSRLEARWAVFLDALGIAYEYEKEGFDLGDVSWYLPDFWLPQQGVWVEIKPAEYDNKGKIIWPGTPKQNALDDISGHRVVTLCGSPGMPRDALNPTPWQSYMGFISGDWMYFWCECSSCHGIGIEFEGRSDRLFCKECYGCASAKRDREHGCLTWVRDSDGSHRCEYTPAPDAVCSTHGSDWSSGCRRGGSNFDKDRNHDTPRLQAAYRKAKQARFEHGERQHA